MRRLLPLVSILTLLMASQGWAAEEKPVEPAETKEESAEPERPPIQPTQILPSKIKPLQAESGDEDSMSKAAPNVQLEELDDANLDALVLPQSDDISGLEIWNDLSAEEIKAMFQGMETKSNSATVRRMSVSLLTTLKPQDDDNANGAIFGLRLSKLLDWGELQKAIDLYKKNDQGTPPADAAKAGIIAMLGKGETGLACLEQKALPLQDAGPDDLWPKIDLFCKGLLSPAAGDDESLRFINAARIYITATSAKSPETIEALNALDPVTIMALGSAGLLNPLLQGKASVKGLNSLTLALLIEKGPQSPDLHLPLIAEATRRGLEGRDRERGNLDAYIAGISNEKSDDKANNYNTFLNEYIKSPAPPSVALLQQSETLLHGTDILIPLFVTENTPLPPEWASLPQGQIKSILRLMALANQPLPLDLVSKAFPDENPAPDVENKKESTGENILFNHFSTSKNGALSSKKAEILAVISYLTAADDKQAFGDSVYDNIFNLTESGNYVMPSDDILSSLKRIAGKKPSAQVVIESVGILTAQPLENIHPAVLYGVLAVFNSAGLSVQTKALGREVLGQILEN